MEEKAISENEIKQFLDSQSDFSLEMKVFSYLTEIGFQAEHGGTYTDPVTEKPRQFDIRSTRRVWNKVIKLTVECKALSTEFPFVIQRVPRTEKENYHEILSCYPPSNDLDRIFSNSKVLRLDSKIYPKNDFVGKSSNQIGRKKGELFGNDSEIYDKWAQSISSAYDLIVESPSEREKFNFSEYFIVIFPIVVVSDKCLWSVDYDNLGNRISDPKNIDEVEFYIGKKFWKRGQTCSEYTISHLKVLTLNGFKKFSEMIKSNDLFFWDKVFPSYLGMG